MKFIKTDTDVNLFENIIETESQVVTHLVIPAGKNVPEHFVDYDVIVAPIKGKAIFGDVTEKREEVVVPGDIVQLHPNEHHYLKAIEDTEVMVIKSKLK